MTTRYHVESDSRKTDDIQDKYAIQPIPAIPTREIVQDAPVKSGYLVLRAAEQVEAERGQDESTEQSSDAWRPFQLEDLLSSVASGPVEW